MPVIGIGAGSDVDGQVLVTHDMIGLFDRFVPKFVKQFAQVRPTIINAIQAYKEEVQQGQFPGPEHSFSMAPEALTALEQQIDSREDG